MVGSAKKSTVGFALWVGSVALPHHDASLHGRLLSDATGLAAV